MHLTDIVHQLKEFALPMSIALLVGEYRGEKLTLTPESPECGRVIAIINYLVDSNNITSAEETETDEGEEDLMESDEGL
jgi:hypothetical protein